MHPGELLRPDPINTQNIQYVTYQVIENYKKDRFFREKIRCEKYLVLGVVITLGLY